MVDMRVAKQRLHGFERVSVRDQATSESASARMAAVTMPESSGTIQASHIALQAVCGQVLDRFAIGVDPSLCAQLKGAALLRKDQSRAGHQSTVLFAIQRHPVSTPVAPFDIALERRDRFRV